METRVTTIGSDGKTETHVGLPVCLGPGRLRLLLTRPYHNAGHVLEIPREHVESVTEVSGDKLGEEPKPAA